ncbi:CGNR zinc finger domain-containing protein [Streptomyces sp. NBC_01579]|uniref:CGNR zinc finger domain-containing protein n=1 Tax=Streptomyces sp. NBC_01579 TaxID=2975885 RepID=UPI003869BB1A
MTTSADIAAAPAGAHQTVVLCTDESGASFAREAALASPHRHCATITHAFTGRPSRAPRNHFTARYGSVASPGYPPNISGLHSEPGGDVPRRKKIATVMVSEVTLDGLAFFRSRRPTMVARKSEQSPLTQPSAADVVLQFVNTHTAGPHRLAERFASAEVMHAWLLENALGSQTTRVTEADATGARALRDALITVLLAHSGDKDITPEVLAQAEEHLRRVASRHPLVTVVTASGASLETTQTGVPGLFGAVLASVTELAQAGLWDRVRACRNQPCHFCFFDRTRNSSGVYCGPKCGSQASMRAYRQRKKELAAETPT